MDGDPRLDVRLVPGGRGARETGPRHPVVTGWIAETAAQPVAGVPVPSSLRTAAGPPGRSGRAGQVPMHACTVGWIGHRSTGVPPMVTTRLPSEASSQSRDPEYWAHPEPLEPDHH